MRFLQIVARHQRILRCRETRDCLTMCNGEENVFLFRIMYKRKRLCGQPDMTDGRMRIFAGVFPQREFFMRDRQ